MLLGGSAVLALGTAGAIFRPGQPLHAAEGTFEVTLTDAEWHKRLNDKQYAVLREEWLVRYPHAGEPIDQGFAGPNGKDG